MIRMQGLGAGGKWGGVESVDGGHKGRGGEAGRGAVG